MHYKLLLFFILLSTAFGVQAQDAELTVISNNKGAPSELKMTMLKSIFKGEKQRWPDGTKVIIALMKTSTPIGSTTSKKIYDMSGDELNKFWLALVFQGKAQAPAFFNTESDLENFVSQTPGAIGITGLTNNTNNKSILIDGKKSL